MSFRTVVITNQAKLNYKNRFLVVKQELEEKYIHLSEIDTVIIDYGWNICCASLKATD